MRQEEEEEDSDRLGMRMEETSYEVQACTGLYLVGERAQEIGERICQVPFPEF